MSKIEKTNTDKITLDNFPRTKKSFKNLLATNDLLNTIERTSKFIVIENQIQDKITVDEPTIVAEIETNRKRALAHVGEAEEPVDPANFVGKPDAEVSANKIWESRERQRVSREKVRNGLQRISTLLRTITSEDKEDKELVSKKPEFLQEDLFGCADNFQGPDKLVGSGGKRS